MRILESAGSVPTDIYAGKANKIQSESLTKEFPSKGFSDKYNVACNPADNFIKNSTWN